MLSPRLLICTAFATFIALTAPVSALVSKDDVRVHQLKNGMKILIHPDNSIPNANMYVFWKVGSRNELPGITGLSHFFEHMMFNGSKNFPPGSFDRVMEAAGGANNAYTSNDLTVYTNWFPTSAFSTIVDLEADRIGYLEIDEKKIESERGVVLSERSTGLENDPWEELSIAVRSTAFLAHPYSWPVIGWESDIRAWQKDDLKRYFETYYNPSNAVMVVAGAVNPDEIIKELEKKIGSIERKNTVPPVRTKEPPQRGERRVWLEKSEITNNHFLANYHVPESRHEDFFALNLLAEILAGGPSSRLYKKLVDEQRVALEVNAYHSESIDPDLFSIAIVGADKTKLKTIETALDAELEALKKKGITAKELQKVKKKLIVSFYRDMETINGKAQLLGNYEIFHGGFENLFKAADKYRAVTEGDIKRVLNLYFKKSNRTVGLLSARQEF